MLSFREEGAESKEALTYVRDDCWATTSNKQLNFSQHVKSCLKIHGRAAICRARQCSVRRRRDRSPGTAEAVRCTHTAATADRHFLCAGSQGQCLMLRLQAGQRTPWTKTLWIYDFRTNQHFTLKTNPLKREDLDEFVTCFHAKNRHGRKETERFHPFAYDDLIKRDKASLDIFWLKDESLEDSANLP